MERKVFLVDNEEWALIYLKNIIPWQENGFQVIGSSTNSVQAAKDILQLRPDVVFTDIRMPELSGLELMSELRDEGLRSEFVICSGFAEFSYAQIAIRLGAFEYCLKITEVRFAGRFSWEICAEDDVMESPCLKMLLQPLIENAVTHGLEDCYRDGRIELKCTRRDGMIEVDICDNGAGIPEDKLSQLRKMLHTPIPAELPSLRSGHIGMMNVHHRIQMVFGKQYGLDILYSGPEGTCIRVKLPDHTASH